LTHNGSWSSIFLELATAFTMFCIPSAMLCSPSGAGA
jgi:hypothetical protein